MPWVNYTQPETRFHTNNLLWLCFIHGIFWKDGVTNAQVFSSHTRVKCAYACYLDSSECDVMVRLTTCQMPICMLLSTECDGLVRLTTCQIDTFYSAISMSMSQQVTDKLNFTTKIKGYVQVRHENTGLRQHNLEERFLIVTHGDALRGITLNLMNSRNYNNKQGEKSPLNDMARVELSAHRVHQPRNRSSYCRTHISVPWATLRNSATCFHIGNLTKMFN